MAYEEEGKSRSIFGFNMSEISQPAIAAGLVIVVRIILAIFKLTPQVPKTLQGTFTPAQLTNAIAGALLLTVFFLTYLWNKWHNRRKHVHGKVQPGKVAIYVAELQGDGKNGVHRTNIIRSLTRELGDPVQVLRCKKELRVEESGNAADDTASANRQARDYLHKHEGDLMIWGQVLAGPPVVIELRFTSRVHDGAEEKRFSYDEKFRLAGDFSQELAAAFAAVVAQQASPALHAGKYVANVLVPVAKKLERLTAKPPGFMDSDDWGCLLYSYALTERTIGEQHGDSNALVRAIRAWRTALQVWTRNEDPLQWAMNQEALGIALRLLGSHERGTERLKEAIDAHRSALEVRTREREPLDWAMTQDNLGNALNALGRRHSGTQHFEEAIIAYRAALEVRTRERVPLEWAGTQLNLGNALHEIGHREAGTARLEEAIEASRAALGVWTRAEAPLDWAMLQNNLGVALSELGARMSGTKLLEEGAQSFRAALQEYTRDRVPLDWALAQSNLGSVLTIIGYRESDTKRLKEAIAAYRAALQEYTRGRVPLDWAMTNSSLGDALTTLGRRENGTARFKEAVESCRAALTELTRGRSPLAWAECQNNLGAALSELGSREGNKGKLEEAVQAFSAALEVRTRECVPLDWGLTQNNLGCTLECLGRMVDAAESFRLAQEELTPQSHAPHNRNATENLARVLTKIGAENSSKGAAFPK